jgi:hypothetical protein
MIPDPICCPYCNALVPLPGEAPLGSRLLCPRCGESFLFRSPEQPAPNAITAAPPDGLATPEAGALPCGARPNGEPRRWSNAAVAGVVLAVMLAMAVVGLTFAQLTVDVRRAQDFIRPPRRPSITLPIVVLAGFVVYIGALFIYLLKLLREPTQGRSPAARLGLLALTSGLGLIAVVNLGLIGMKTAAMLGWTSVPPPPPLPDDVPLPVRRTPPAELPGLGYLPPETNVAAGLHIADALREPAGREFLGQFRVRSIDLGLAEIEQTIGLKLDDIDHVVAGLQMRDQLPPPAVLVVRTRRPCDQAAILDRLKATPAPEPSKKKLYRFKLEKPSLQLGLWFPAPDTLLIALRSEDLEAAPSAPRLDIDHLPRPVQALLREHMAPGTQAWVAGHVTDWKAVEFALTIPWIKLPREDLALLTKLRTFGLWLQLAPDVAYHQRLEAGDEAGAEAIQKYLSARKGGEPEPLRLLGSRPETEPIARELARTWKLERQGTVVTASARAEAALVRKALAGP